MSLDTWQLTILLLSGLRLMRPDKAWRPIVSVEVEGGRSEGKASAGGVYETMLGVDGQCVNQRESMILYDVEPSTKVAINVWHRSQSKKKKRRVLVASASCCLSELAKKQEGTDGKLEVRLMCRSADKVNSAARGRPQRGAVLRLKLRPPASFVSTLSAPPLLISASSSTVRPISINADAGPSRSTTLDTVSTDESSRAAESVHDIEDGREEEQLVPSPLSERAEKAWFEEEDTPDFITFDEPQPQPQATLRRRRVKVKPFCVDTDDECASVSASEGYSETDSLLPRSPGLALNDDDGNSNTFVDNFSSSSSNDDDDLSVTPHLSNLTLSLKHSKQTISTTDELVFHASTGDIITFSSSTTETGEKVWIAAARDVLLPMYTEKITISPAGDDMMRIEKLLAALTLYGELRAAAASKSEEAFEPLVRRLQNEWAVVGTLLLALAGVNTAMFTIQDGGMFTVTEHAALAIALSSVTSGLGITCTAWFFMRYNWADTSTFITRSRDLFSTHFFFALSARVPTLCMFISACSLTACLALIAFATFPGGVLILCFVVGILMSLQFIVFGVSWLGKQVISGGRASGEHMRGVAKQVRRMTGSGAGESVG